jgi:heme-degrading monooxygenase HmoA
MIARIWHGKTTTATADAYMEEYFLQTGLADYQSTEGNQGVIVLRKDQAGEVDFLMLTMWKSEDAIMNFAGENINKARYYPEDNRYFTEMEENVVHYQVLINQVNDDLK